MRVFLSFWHKRIIKFKKGKRISEGARNRKKTVCNTSCMAKKLFFMVVVRTWGLRSLLQALIALLVTGIVIATVYFTHSTKSDTRFEEEKEMIVNKCIMFDGKWVFNNVSYPLYVEKQCTYMSDQLACEKFGRKDLSYQNWRWQPNQCDLPRFNATILLERLRGKRLVFVGDSLNRGQWVSMVCLVEAAVPAALKSMHTNGSLITFKAIEYNATIEFYWAPLLVESNSDDPVNHRLPDRIVRVQAIEKHARHWTDADILVFNSYLWWKRPKMNILWGSFGSGNGIYNDVEMLRSYQMALKTWSDWLEIHVNRNKTQLFFVSMSPTHFCITEERIWEDQDLHTSQQVIMIKPLSTNMPAITTTSKPRFKL